MNDLVVAPDQDLRIGELARIDIALPQKSIDSL